MSHPQRNSSHEASNKAPTTASMLFSSPSQKARQFQLWVKHSLPPATVATTATAIHASMSSSSATATEESSLSIDQALNCLSGYRNEFPVLSPGKDHDDDWLLDAASFSSPQERRQSQQLLEELYPSKTQLTEELLEEQLLLLVSETSSSIAQGQQTFQFADFPVDEEPKDVSERIDINEEDGNDDFGDFQQATNEIDDADKVLVPSTNSNSNPAEVNINNDGGGQISPERPEFRRTILEKEDEKKTDTEISYVESIELHQSDKDRNDAPNETQSAEEASCSSVGTPIDNKTNKSLPQTEDSLVPKSPIQHTAIDVDDSGSPSRHPNLEVYQTPHRSLDAGAQPATPLAHNYSGEKLFASCNSLSTDSSSASEGSNRRRKRRSSLVQNNESEEGDDNNKLTSQNEEEDTNANIPSVVELFARRNNVTPIQCTTPSPSFSKSSLSRPRGLALHRKHSSITAQQSTSSLQSPEGRFLRRHYWQTQDDDLQIENDGDEDCHSFKHEEASLGSLESLVPINNAYFWTEQDEQAFSHAAITKLLKDLEWDWIPYWKLDHLLQKEDCDESFVPLWLEQMTLSLSEWDETHQKMTKKLYKALQPHAPRIQRANQYALELSQNLQLCQMYWRRCQDSLNVARYGTRRGLSDNNSTSKVEEVEEEYEIPGGVESAKQLLQWCDTKDLYGELSEILQRIQGFFQHEQQIQARIQGLDVWLGDESVSECQSIMASIRNLQSELYSFNFARLHCLEDFRRRVDKLSSHDLVSSLHDWLGVVALRGCPIDRIQGGLKPPTLDTEAYRRLVEMILFVELCHSSAETVAQSFCASLHTALLMETQRSFGLSLLHPSDEGDVDESSSDYEMELDTMARQTPSDPGKLAIWTHNLVTIRFDFELSKNHLPAVYHKLCWHLTNVLHTHHCVLEWHKQNTSSGSWLLDDWKVENAEEDKEESTYSQVLERIHQEMLTRKSSIWNTCIKVLEECLEEYLKYVSKKKLFERIKDDTLSSSLDDSQWYSDAVGLQDVLGLTDQFLSLQKEFLDDEGPRAGKRLDRSVNDGSLLREKLHDVMKRHLRAFHVEAMNSTGKSLFQEEWSAKEFSKMKRSDNRVENIQLAILHEITCLSERGSSIILRSKLVRFVQASGNDDHSLFGGDGENPFDIVIENFATTTETKSPKHESFAHGSKIASCVQQFLGTFSSPAAPVPLLPNCLIETVFPWMSRGQLLIENLPPISEDVCEVLTDVVDLYFTTVFRICSGNAKNERILLGLENAPATISLEEALTRQQGSVSSSSSTTLFGFRRSSGTPSSKYSSLASTENSKPRTNLPMCTDAELCAPLVADMNDVHLVQSFLQDAQTKLKSVAKLDLVDSWIPDADPSKSRTLAELACETARVLEKRQVALWGCAFLGLAVEVMVHLEDGVESALETFKSYVLRLLASLPKLLDIGNRMCCMRAIRGRIIVQQILNVGYVWEDSSKLHEQPNEYLDSVCNFLALLWCSLRNASKIPPGALKLSWKYIQEATFAALLDGFSRVPFCSTEGRALMSMDLASLCSELSGKAILQRLEQHQHAQAEMPPPISCVRGRGYVDTYVKVFYFPPKDAMAWIRGNYTQYSRNHMVALIVGSTIAALSENRPQQSQEDLRQLVQSVTSLYSKSQIAFI